MNQYISIDDNFKALDSLSGHIVGLLEINHYDKDHLLINTQRTHNDLTIAGASSIIEYLFNSSLTILGEANNNARKFFLNGDYTKKGETPTITTNNLNRYIPRVVGFCVGSNGVDNNSNIKSTVFGEYNITPRMFGNSTSVLSNYNTAYYSDYIKKFTSITTKVTSSDSSSLRDNGTRVTANGSILCLSEMTLDISDQDFSTLREPNGQFYINQVGLVSIESPDWNAATPTYNNARLFTVANFKSRELTIGDTLTITYRFYCM
jgi:hypothetical protein